MIKADVLCLAAALAAVGARVPWDKLLLVRSAGAAGLRSPDAVAAVLYYRIITFKVLVTLVWIGCRSLRERQARGEAGEREDGEQVPVVEVGDRDREHEQDDGGQPGQRAAGPGRPGQAR